MDNSLFLIFRTFFITMMTIGMMASLTEFQYKRKKLLLIMLCYSVWVIASSAALLWIGGELLLMRMFFFTISVPATFLTYKLASDTPTQAVFNYMTQIMLSIIAVSTIRIITEFFELSYLANILLMVVFYVLIIVLEWKFLRKPFRAIIRILPSNWGVLTLIPCMFCMYVIFVASWPRSYLDNMTQIIYVYMAIIPMIIVYIAVFKSLINQYRRQVEQQDAELLMMQIAAMKEKIQKVKELEDEIRIQRHDLRHRLQTVTELVMKGESNSALEFLDAAKVRLNEQKEIRWCSLPVLDAVFTSYFDQAKRHDIQIDAKIAIPENLSVMEEELSIVIANVLENAINANMKISHENRKIRLRTVGTPGFVMEIANPSAEIVQLDEKGFPVATEEGHGIGMKSVYAFCKKYDAVCEFTQENGWFYMRFVL